MAALDFPTATAAGQTFEADTGVIYVYVGTPPNGFWSANATVSGQAALDARYVQVAGDSMTGALNVAGNVGIGTTSPTTKVEVVDTLQATANNDYSLAIRGDDSGTDGESAQIFLGAINATTRGTVIAAERQSTSNNHDLIFKTSAASAAPSERVRIDSSGNVGIGVTSPGRTLDVSGSIRSGGSTNPFIALNDNTTEAYFEISGSQTRISSGTSQPLVFRTGSDERMRIDSSGNVGIGTASPTSLGSGFTEVIISGNTEGAGLQLQDIDGNVKAGIFTSDISNTATLRTITNHPLTFRTNNTERMRIESDGDFLLGGSTNYAFIRPWDTTTGNLIIGADQSATGTGGSATIFRNRGSESMRIDSSGVLRVGGTDTYNSSDKLTLVNNSGNCSLTIDSTSSGESSVFFADGATGNEAYRGYLQYQHSLDALLIGTAANERMRIDSLGNVGIGSAPINSAGYNTLSIGNAGAVGGQIHLKNNAGQNVYIWSDSNGTNIYNQSATSQVFYTNAQERMRIDSSGRLLVGVTSSYANSGADDLQVGNNSSSTVTGITLGSTVESSIRFADAGNASAGLIEYNHAADSMRFYTNGTYQRMLIDSSGRLLVNHTADTAPDGYSSKLQLCDTSYQGSSLLLRRDSNNSGGSTLIFAKSRSSTKGGNGIISNGDDCGSIRWYANDGTDQNSELARIRAIVDGSPSANDTPGALTFWTAPDSTNSVNERMRIDNQGNVGFGITSHKVSSSTDQGHWIGKPGSFAGFAVASAPVIYVNRISSDGELIRFRHNGVDEGNISVSGTTVSYNGAHLARWSQLPGNAIRVAILRGTVLSNIDEMCAWGGETNEQLNRMKISDVEGDRNVSGVFQAWDEDDDEYTDDFYCAMTGDFIIRIGKDVTVELGDLLMSAGDGTAKPQEDDIIRSKTIAKVTSTHVSETYADGSYCVPCVLMAC